VLQHVAQLLQRLAPVAEQRHHALVGLLTRQAVFRIQRDRAAALVVHVHHLAQCSGVRHFTHHRRRGAQAQVRLHFGHGHLDGPVTEDLKDQRPVELDVALHQHPGGRHFSEQFAHGRRVCASGCVARAPAQDFLPGFGQAHDHAAHRQAVKNEFVEFGHAWEPGWKSECTPRAVRLARRRDQSILRRPA
jgi:hypothetical protein